MNNYIVRSYRDVIVVTKIATRTTGWVGQVQRALPYLNNVDSGRYHCLFYEIYVVNFVHTYFAHGDYWSYSLCAYSPNTTIKYIVKYIYAVLWPVLNGISNNQISSGDSVQSTTFCGNQVVDTTFVVP